MHPYLLDTLASERRAALAAAAARGATHSARPSRRVWTILFGWLRPAPVDPAPEPAPATLTVAPPREAPVSVLRPRPEATHRSARVVRRACSREAS